VAFLVAATGVDLVTTISSVMACIGNALIRFGSGPWGCLGEAVCLMPVSLDDSGPG
jgi:hypothetical protein